MLFRYILPVLGGCAAIAAIVRAIMKTFENRRRAKEQEVAQAMQKESEVLALREERERAENLARENHLLEAMRKTEADTRASGKLHTVMAFSTETLAECMGCEKLEDVVPMIEALRGRGEIYQKMGLWVLTNRSYPIAQPAVRQDGSTIPQS